MGERDDDDAVLNIVHHIGLQGEKQRDSGHHPERPAPARRAAVEQADADPHGRHAGHAHGVGHHDGEELGNEAAQRAENGRHTDQAGAQRPMSKPRRAAMAAPEHDHQ